MSPLLFRIEQPHAATEEIAVEHDQILLGSAAHCDVRLPVDQSRPEQVQIRREVGGVWARALSFQPPPRLNGAPFDDAPVASDSVVAIGNVRITITLPADTADGVDARSPARKSSPVILFGGILGCALLLWFIFADVVRPTDARAARETPPALWTSAAPACPRVEPRQALAFANEKLLLARSKRERRPFSARDGVAAVPLFESAAACFRFAGDEPGARQADAAAAALRADIDLDYRTHQMRLEHALSVEDQLSVVREMEALLAITDGKTGAYVTWLAVQHRQLRLQLDQKKDK